MQTDGRNMSTELLTLMAGVYECLSFQWSFKRFGSGIHFFFADLEIEGLTVYTPMNVRCCREMRPRGAIYIDSLSEVVRMPGATCTSETSNR